MKSNTELQALTSFYKLLANESRLAILLALREGEDNVAGICGRTGLSQTLVSHQLATLHRNRVVCSRKDGRRTYYVLADKHIDIIVEFALDHLAEKEVHHE
ncbi:MAG: ArsR/SmtB family transcription factor [Candidatus Cryosericum sp.]